MLSLPQFSKTLYGDFHSFTTVHSLQVHSLADWGDQLIRGVRSVFVIRSSIFKNHKFLGSLSSTSSHTISFLSTFSNCEKSKSESQPGPYCTGWLWVRAHNPAPITSNSHTKSVTKQDSAAKAPHTFYSNWFIHTCWIKQDVFCDVKWSNPDLCQRSVFGVARWKDGEGCSFPVAPKVLDWAMSELRPS